MDAHWAHILVDAGKWWKSCFFAKQLFSGQMMFELWLDSYFVRQDERIIAKSTHYSEHGRDRKSVLCWSPFSHFLCVPGQPISFEYEAVRTLFFAGASCKSCFDAHKCSCALRASEHNDSCSFSKVFTLTFDPGLVAAFSFRICIFCFKCISGFHCLVTEAGENLITLHVLNLIK